MRLVYAMLTISLVSGLKVMQIFEEQSISSICGKEVKNMYEPTELDSLSSSTGKSVMVTSTIENDFEYAKCTKMKCDDKNPCCNSCSNNPSFGKYSLISSAAATKMIGCYGSNCDWRDNCTYEDGDRVVIYGVVSEFGNIFVDYHCKAPDELSTDTSKCVDLSNVFMLPGTIYCMRFLGVGIMNGRCKYISGCSDLGYEFFETIEDCENTCNDEKKEDKVSHMNQIDSGEKNETNNPISVIDEPSSLLDPGTCEELSSFFMLPGTIYCQMVLGVGIMNGRCSYISGCSDQGFALFKTMKGCDVACSDTKSDEVQLETLDDCDSCIPDLKVDKPFLTSPFYIPYEGIRVCFENVLEGVDIFIPGCNVFTLQNGNNFTNSIDLMQNETINIFEDCNTSILPANETYCSNYEFNFETSGEYFIEAEYGLNCSENALLENCDETFKVSSDNLSVVCPDAVDCMPSTQEPLWNICGVIERFSKECPNTYILM